MPPRLGATRPRRRRARSRPRHPRARLRAARSSLVDGVGAGSSTICVRHHSPAVVALGLVRDHARGLQVIQPALHAACDARARTAPARRVARDRAPAHHRRQPRHQLPDRRREPRRALRVPEPEQVALDRVRARLQPIITGRRAAARAARAAQQRGHHHAPGLGRQRLDRRPIPTTRRPSSSSVRMCDPAAPPTPEGAAAASSTAPASGRSRHSWRAPRAAAARRRSGARRRRPSTGVGDPSGARLQFGARAYVGAHPTGWR